MSNRPDDTLWDSPEQPAWLPAGRSTLTRDEFDRICTVFRGPLKSIVDARIDPQVAQRLDSSDIVQEAFLEAYLRLEDFCLRRPMSFSEWLRVTTLQQLKIAIRKHRLARKRSVSSEVSYERSSIHALADQLTAVQDHRDRLPYNVDHSEVTCRALERLKASDREILLLRYVNELSNSAAAKLLGISETLASKRHCRALIRLQKEIEQLET